VFAGPKFDELKVRVSASHDQRTCILEILQMLSDFEKDQKAAESGARQGDTDGGLPSMPGAAGSVPSDARVWSALARQRAQLLSFAARFALELRKHGAFGMNRDEGELLKEFDEWMLANPFPERGQL
jgi:hypothetical protein